MTDGRISEGSNKMEKARVLLKDDESDLSLISSVQRALLDGTGFGIWNG